MKKTVNYTTLSGVKRQGFLIKENNKTVIATPFKWVKGDPIKLNRIKNHVVVGS